MTHELLFELSVMFKPLVELQILLLALLIELRAGAEPSCHYLLDNILAGRRIRAVLWEVLEPEL